VERLVGRSHKTIITVGHLMLSICHWPEASWPIAISRPRHAPVWPRQDWLAYEQRTDSHGVPPTRDTEVVDLAVGTRIVHPGAAGEMEAP
jgi:hypothetical protein